jgi:hypothetical protein
MTSGVGVGVVVWSTLIDSSITMWRKARDARGDEAGECSRHCGHGQGRDYADLALGNPWTLQTTDERIGMPGTNLTPRAAKSHEWLEAA